MSTTKALRPPHMKSMKTRFKSNGLHRWMKSRVPVWQQMLAGGMTAHAIAEHDGISPQTVRRHLKSIGAL